MLPLDQVLIGDCIQVMSNLPEELVFVRNRSKRAVVLPNGSIRCDGLEGSIHQVAQSLGNPGLNGWAGWLVKDEHGNLVLLDDLRKRYLE